jgi:hypothetical protein
MRPIDAFALFTDFYSDFDRQKADEMMKNFNLNPKQPIQNHVKRYAENFNSFWSCRWQSEDLSAG